MVQRPGHRVDIDGLRGVAVLLVVLFHAGVPWLAGGYIGVDVFFVISGYLITGLLIDEHARSGRVSLTDFWARRIRRIIPALAVVVIATLTAGWWILLPWEFDSLLHSARATVLSIANIHFWQSSGGYFADNVEQEPLLHMWSLGVEEQFYLALPLVVVAALRLGRRHTVTATLATLGVASLAWSIVEVTNDQQAAFYLPQFRAWELLVGSGLALARPTLRRIPTTVANTMTWTGLATIVAAALWYTDRTRFPGTTALAPVLGTAAIIAAGVTTHTSGTAQRLLGTTPMQWIGRWSYSWYLWHWPALVLVRQHQRTDSLPRDLLVSTTTLALAATSWRYIEEPFRRSTGRTSPRRALAAGALVVAVLAGTVTTTLALRERTTEITLPAVTTAGSGATSSTSPGWPDDVDWSDTALLDELEASRAIPRVACTGIDMVRPFDPECELLPGDRYLVLVGDSHAAHLAAPLLQVARANGWGMRIASLAACPVLPGVVVANESGTLEACTLWADDVLADIEAHAEQIAVVVTSARSGWYMPGDGYTDESIWEAHIVGADSVERSVELWQQGVARHADLLAALDVPLVWVHDVPEFRERPSECLPYRSVDDCSTPRERASAYRSPALVAEAAALADRTGVVTIDPFDTFCTIDSCRPVRGRTILYRDGDHLTIDGALLLVEELDRALRSVTDG